jgi:Domain of unknown function (DUF4383)
MSSRSKSQRNVSRSVLRVFGPTLILTGLAGFIIPKDKAATSGAPAYNVFHLIFGSLGIACARSRRPWPSRVFNVGFGAVDLYQAVASRRGWFPQKWFRWKVADDVLHAAIGAGLVAAGLSRRSAD